MDSEKEEYYMQDFDTYASLFRGHAMCMVEMMRIMDEIIQTDLNIAVGRPKQLYDMVNDLLYKVDRSYKAKKNIADRELEIIYRSFDEGAKDQMRNVFREEVERYFNNQTNND